MDSNTHSTVVPAGLARLAAAVEELAGQDPGGLPAATAAQRVLALRGLLDRLEGQWLRELAGVDGRGHAGAEDGVRAESTAGWLRRRLRVGASQASGWVRTARACFRGPLVAATGRALVAGQVSSAHAAVLAHATAELPPATVVAAEPVLLQAAGRLDPPRLRRLVAHLRWVADPDRAGEQAERRHRRRGLWLSATLEGMVAVDGLLEAEAGESVLAALAPLARPAGADDDLSGAQRRADALGELARRSLEGGRLPQTGGVRPQLQVTIELASLLGTQPAPGGQAAGVGYCPPIPLSGWPATPRSPARSSPATATVVATPTTPATAATATRAAWPDACKRRSGCCRRCLAAHRPSRWSWAAPPG
jgi:Domain of unknown function (DUF222)